MSPTPESRGREDSTLRLGYSEGVPTQLVEGAVEVLTRRGYETEFSRISEAENLFSSLGCVLTTPDEAPKVADEENGLELGQTPILVLGDSGDEDEREGGENYDATDTVSTEGEHTESLLAMRIEKYAFSGENDDARLSDGYFVLNDDWEFEYLNTNSEDLLGRDPDYLLGKNVWEEFPEAVDGEFYREYTQAMETDEPTSVEDYYEPLDTVFRVNVYPLEGEISVYFRDVTKDREDEDILRGRVRGGQGVGTCLVEPDDGNRIVYADEAFLEMTGYSESEVVGETMTYLYGTETSEMKKAEVERALEEERPHDLKILNYRDNGTKFWNHLYITPSYDEDGVSFLLSHLDITAMKIREEELSRRNEYLTVNREATNEMISAESSDGVVSILAESAQRVFEEGRFYFWEDGALHADDDVVSEKGDPTWTAFSREETVKTESSDGKLNLDAHVHKRGVLSVRNQTVSEPEEEFIAALVSSAERALGRIEREEELRDLTNALRSKNEDLSRLAEIDTAVRELVKKIVSIDGREEIELTVCEHLLKVRDWDYIWIAESDGEGDVRERRNCGTKPEFGRRLQEVVEARAPVTEATREGETVVTDNIASEESSDWRSAALDEGYLSVATVPIVHGMREFGALEVYSTESEAFTGDYLNALVDVVEILGYALASAERRSMVLSGGYNRLKLAIEADDSSFVGRLADELGTEVELKAVASRPQGAVLYVKIEDEDDARVNEVAKSYGVRIECTGDEYEIAVTDTGLVEHVAEVGGRVTCYSSTDGQNSNVIATVNLPRDIDVRDFVENLSERYSDPEVVAKTTHSNTPEAHSMPDMTERQEDILRLAYTNGYFDWPREKNGEELSDSLGIARSTFHQHLREAERKVMGELIDEPN